MEETLGKATIEDVLEKYRDKLQKFAPAKIEICNHPRSWYFPWLGNEEVIGLEFPTPIFPKELPRKLEGYDVVPYSITAQYPGESF
jgi:hypothetical protein